MRLILSLPKLAISRATFPGLQEPAILETEYAIVRICCLLPTHEDTAPWAAEPPVHMVMGTPKGREAGPGPGVTRVQ